MIKKGEWPINFPDLSKTEAFKRRDKAWSFESWDYTEWEECVEEAKKELQAGRVST
jgi:hypothetical protein